MLSPDSIVATANLPKLKIDFSEATIGSLSQHATAESQCLLMHGRVLVVIGQVLLIFTAISLCTMPVTQHLWTWDHFLHGGRDFELGMLMVLSLLSLVLVLAKSCKQCIHALLSALAQSRSPFRDPVSQAADFG